MSFTDFIAAVFIVLFVIWGCVGLDWYSELLVGGFEIDDSLDSVDLDDIGSCLAKHYQEGKLH